MIFDDRLAQWSEYSPITQDVACSIPAQYTFLYVVWLCIYKKKYIFNYIHTTHVLSRKEQQRHLRYSSETPTFYQYLAMRNTAYVTGCKLIAVWLQSISGLSAINPLVAFYDIHALFCPMLLFYKKYISMYNDLEVSHWMGDQNLLSRAPPSFGRHVKLLVPAAFAVVSIHSFKEGWRQAGGRS
jgi:hypothetical protein